VNISHDIDPDRSSEASESTAVSPVDRAAAALAHICVDRDLAIHAHSGDAATVLGRDQLDADLSLASILHPADRPVVQALLATAASIGLTGENAPDPAGEAHLRVRDSSGRYRILIARCVQRESGAADPAHESTGAATLANETARYELEVRDARAEPQRLGRILTPFTAVMMETAEEIILVKDAHHIIVAASRSATAQCDGIDDWRGLCNRSDYDVFAEELADLHYALEARIYGGEASVREIQRVERADGTPGWVDTRKHAVRDDAGKIIGLHAIVRDITAQVEAVVTRELAASLFSFCSDGVVLLDADGVVLRANATLCESLGCDQEEVVGRRFESLKFSESGERVSPEIWARLRQTGHWEGEVLSRGPQGTKEELARFTAVRDGEGRVQQYLGLYCDISDRTLHKAQLEKIIHFDPITGLANRTLLADRLERALASCNRYEKQAAVAYMDLDEFKLINDSHGHQIGDQYLNGIARNLKAVLRETDTLARVSGDEFVAVITDLDDPAMLEPVILRLLAAAAEPVAMSATGKMLSTSASIGVSLYPRDGMDADQLLRRADQAMYAAKQRGKNRVNYYDSGGAIGDVGREELYRALHSGEIALRYQPKVNLLDGSLVGVEALVRWNHPERGLISPAGFLPLIERENLTIELGRRVLEEATRQARSWGEQGLLFPISVNISGVHLLHNSFVDSLHEMLTGESRQLLQIEVLETSALDDTDAVAEVIDRCSSLNVNFCLDDFGTGFSSLTHLRKLPVQAVKIDCSFVMDMLDDPEDFSIVSSIVGLCAGLDREVIAEGVCSDVHAQALIDMGCVYGQGFAIARPMPPEELSGWLEDWRSSESWLRFRPDADAQANTGPGTQIRS
jgi:diguanylate cyclase (GGDEF)-like protein/PAS domain S-box-containing protein